MKIWLVTAALFFAGNVSAKELIFPVVTGTMKDRAYSTTVQVSTPNSSDVACTFSYAGPERVGKPIRSDETIPAGKTKVYEDFLSEIAAAGTVRVSCSADVEIVARVQDSLDGGKTFRDGRTYRPFPIANVLHVNESRTLKTRTDVVLAEVGGKPVNVVVQVQDAKGTVFGRKTYDIPPHAQRVVNLDAVREKLPELDIVISVPSGEGSIIIGKETREASLAKVALRGASTRVAISSTSVPPAVRQLVMSSFKAAPFQEPMTGLIYMRDRWYDPSTGTFLTPDPEGYADSSNPYIYCGGDPVNCSDPTGRLGDGSDARNDFRMKEQAELDSRAAAWCRANPVECARRDVRSGAILRGLGAAGQTAGGVSAFLATGPLPEVATKTFGAITTARGLENLGTAAIEFWTGEPHDTATRRTMYLALVKAGQSPAQASRISGWAEAGLDITTSIGSGYIAFRAQQLNALVNLRIAYETEVQGLANLEQQMIAAGRTEEEIGRALSLHRRALGVQFKDLTPAAKRAEIYARNLEKYGDELGPTVDYLRARGKTWQQIIQSAKTPSGADILPPALTNHPAYVQFKGGAKLQ